MNGAPPPDSVEGFLIDGFDQSGASGWLFSVNNALEAWTDNKGGVRAAAGVASPRETSDSWKAGALGGPLASAALKIGSIASDAATGEADSNTFNRITSMAPGQNWIGLKMLGIMNLGDNLDAVSAGNDERSVRP